MKKLRLDVPPEMAGHTIASAVRETAQVSHSTAKGILARGLVMLNARVMKEAAHRLRAGDRIDVAFDPDTRYSVPRRMAPTSGFRVLVEDPHLIVVDKDAGVLTVPTASPSSDTDGSLADRLLAMYADRGARAPHVWVVHRIDRFTSGLVLFARTAAAAEVLKEQFARRQARREYLAVCEGLPQAHAKRLESLLVEDPRSLKVSETKDRTRGRRAACSYRIEERFASAALLRVTLETGRRNQIRVQFAAIGHPLVGDRTYGKPSQLISRVALHAARLGFTHPHTGRSVSLESPMPADMTRLLRRLRQMKPA